MLLSHNIDISLTDNQGNDCLAFLAVLIEKGLFRESFELATALLEHSRCDPNRLNQSGLTLLSYSVAQGDATIDITRLLLNHGASVLPFR